MSKPVRAWHFVGEKQRDGAPVPPDGVTLKYTGIPVLCSRGYHASLDPYDALQFAPGGTLCLVECGGTILYQEDKLVCTERKIIARIDAEKLLRSFARKCALDVIHLWNAPKVVADYLRTGDESLRDAAQDAAWAATRAAAQDAAWYATQDAAWYAARAATRAAAQDAAWAATRAAAQDAAWAAARAAAQDAAQKKQRADFSEMVNSKFSTFLNNLD